MTFFSKTNCRLAHLICCLAHLNIKSAGNKHNICTFHCQSYLIGGLPAGLLTVFHAEDDVSEVEATLLLSEGDVRGDLHHWASGQTHNHTWNSEGPLYVASKRVCNTYSLQINR